MSAWRRHVLSGWDGSRARRRGRAALAASIVLHLLVAVGLQFLPRGSVRPRAPASDVAVDFTLIQPVARENEVTARSDDRQPAPPPERDRRRAPSRQVRSDGGPPAPAPLADVPPSQDIQQGAVTSANHAGADVDRGARVDLSFEGLAGDAKLRALPSARGEPLLYPSPPTTRRRRSVDELTSESARQADAEENVQRGRAHPLLFEYLRAARTRLEPEATRLAEALPLGTSLSMQGWGRGYLSRVAEVGRKTAGRDTQDATVYDPISGGRRSDLFPAYNEANRAAVAGAERRTAEICLGVAPDRPVVVTLRRSSGHAALDQLAIDSFQKAAFARPMAADVRPGLACYQVRISAFRMPPLPTLSIGIKNGRPDVIYPLKRLTKVTVDLVSVDHGDGGKPRRLLRAR